MLKNIILIVVVVSFSLLSISCSGPVSTAPIVIAQEQLPTEQIEKTTVADEKPLEKIVPVSEFISQALKNKYKNGDTVLVSGTALEVKEQQLDQVKGKWYNSITMGPETAGYIAIFVSEGVIGGTKFDTGYQSYASIATIMAGGDVIIKGVFEYVNPIDSIIRLGDSTVQ